MNIIRMGLFCALVATACYGGPAKHSDNIQSNLELRFDRVVVDGDIEMKLLEIKDSRCPVGANCFLAGEVSVVLVVNCNHEEQTEPVELTLTRPVRGKPTLGTACGHLLELINVSPYPKEGVTIERSEHQAEIQIEKGRP